MATQESDGDRSTDGSLPSGDFARPTAGDVPADEPSAYTGDETLPPPAYTIGRYEFSRVSPPTHPPDPILPFIAPPVARRRRSDWPVLVVALIISAVVLAVCCLAGYFLYASRGPLIS